MPGRFWAVGWSLRLRRLLTGAEYLIGAAVLGIVLGASAAAAWILVVRRGDALRGVPRAVALATLTALFVFAAHLVPGVLGILSRGTVAACAMLLLALASLLAPRIGSGRTSGPPAVAPDGRVSRWLAIAAVAAVCVYAIAHIGGHFDEGTLQSDAATFHLPNVAEWINGGSFWAVDDFVYDRAAGNYPQTGDVYMLAVILPFDYDFLARLVGWPFVALLGLAVFAAARELAASRATAALVAAAVLAMPAVVYIAPVGLGDPEMLGLFAAGGFFLLRWWRTRAGFDLALAGIGLGLSLGTRWYAVYAVGAVLAVWLVALHAERRRERRAEPAGERRGSARLGAALALGGLVAVCGGFWFLRTLVESGNPVFPVRVAPLGIELFDAPMDRIRGIYGFTLADYLGRPGVYRDSIFPQFLDFMGFVALALWAGVAAAAVAAVRAWRRGTDGFAPRVVALAAVAALIGLAYIVTPYTAAGPENDPSGAAVNARYVIPALVAAAPALAWLLGRLRGRVLLAAQAVLALAVLDGLLRAADQPGGEVGRGSVLAAAVMVAAAIALGPRLRPLADRVRGSRKALVASAAVAALALLVAGAAIESGFSAKRYVGLNPVVDLVNTQAPAGQRVGLVGEGWVSYPLFGPRLENEVRPVGQRIDGMLRAYPDRESFSRDVRQEGYDLVLVTEIDTLDPERPLRQERWLERLPYVEVAAGSHPIAPTVGVRLYAPKDSDLAEGAEPASEAPESGGGAAPGPIGGAT